MNLFEQYIRLSELATLIDNTLHNTFGGNTFWVKAETSDIKNYPDRQYCFLTLIEKSGSSIVAKMDAVIWRQHYDIIQKFVEVTGISFEKNISLLMRIQVSFSASYGLRLQVLELDHGFTIGAIELQRQATLKQLLVQNPDDVALVNGTYITYNNRLLLPRVIQNIALITAPGSDGERDFIHELSHNLYGYTFNVDSYLTTIQGKEAEKSILSQLDLILSFDKPYDIVAIVRGGGSQTDFSAFDTYNLGLKIASFPIPIIAGIGHERNVSIADLMCFASVKTPTKAASFIVEVNAVFEKEVEQLKQKLVQASSNIIKIHELKLEKKCTDLTNAITHFFKNRSYNLSQKELAIKLLDPARVLQRGYAILSNKQGIILHPEKLQEGDPITATTHSAVLHLTTHKVIKKEVHEN